jgi:hypothetical protein
MSVDYFRIRGLILKNDAGPWDTIRITRDKIEDIKVLDLKEFIVEVYNLKDNGSI